MYERAPYLFVPKKLWLPLVLLILCLPSAALAGKIKDVWVSGIISERTAQSVSAGDIPEVTIHWWHSDKTNRYYLFLPAGADLSSLQFHYDATEAVAADGTEILDGGWAKPLTPGAQVTLTCGKTKYPLTVMQSQNVPALFLTTASGGLRKIHSSKDVEETGTLVMLNIDGSLEYDGLLDQVKLRGNSSAAYPKKPYQIKLDKATDLSGMGEAKTWVLLANYMDNSLLRNTVSLVLGRAAGMAYTSRSQTVDLYINSDYLGAYDLCEKVEIGENRIGIADLKEATEAVNDKPLSEYPVYGPTEYASGKSKGYKIPNDPADITGGYLIELEKPYRYLKEASGFMTRRGLPVVIKEPTEVSKAQAAYISGLIQSFENAIFSEDGIDRASGKRYTDIIDLESLADKYIVDEISKNLDANRTSFYLYKPADSQSSLIYAGPVWDYDLAFGNFPKLTSSMGFAANKDRAMTYYWFPQLYAKTDFYQAVVAAYQAKFIPALKVLLGLEEDPTGELLSIDDYAAEISACADMNFSRWQVFNAANHQVKTGADYAQNIDYLKNYLSGRMAFLSGEWTAQ